MITYKRSHVQDWCVAAIQPGKGIAAADHLRRLGHEVFAPSNSKTVRHARRTTLQLTPVFPGYLFVAIDRSATAWRSINGTIGVRHLICAGGRPLSLPEGFVEGLMLLAD